MIEKIEINNFRQFEYLEVKDLKRVNFFIGKNNCGKSTLLEALFLMMNPQEVQNSVKLALFRGLDIINQEYLTLLFRNLDEQTPIDLSMSINKEKIGLHIAPKTDKTIYFDVKQKEKQYDYNITFADANNKVTPYPAILRMRNEDMAIEPPNRELINKFGSGFFLADYLHGNFLNDSIKKIFQSSKENILIENMQFFDSSIQNIILIGDVIYVDTKNHPRMPYYLMGDGFKKHLKIILALVSDEMNYIFLDEIENGLHFENIKNILRAILKLSKEKNIQLFITTHCNEVLADLSKIMHEDEFITQKDDVGIVKISTENDQYRALNRSMDDLDSFIRTETEIR